MTSVEGLRSSRDSYSVALRGLLRDYERDSRQIFLLVEGKDGDYYRPRTSSVFSGFEYPFSFRNVKGKRNLKDLVAAIRRNLALTDQCFAAFFDRDFEQDLADITHESAFVTDCYAIENYYTSEAVLREMIQSILFSDIIHYDEDMQTIDDIVCLYVSMRQQFHNCVSLFNQWAWVQRHSSRTGKIDLDKFDVENFLEMDFDRGIVLQKYNLDDLNLLAPQRLPIKEDELPEAQRWFSERSASKSNRGKQEICFLYWFITETISRAAAGADPFKTVKKCSKQISRKGTISELSVYAHTPMCLTDFLSRIKDRFEVWVRSGVTYENVAPAHMEA